MSASDRERLAAVEQQLADVSRKLRATQAHVKFLRALLAEDVPELASAERDADRILDAISGPSKPTAAQPKLRLIEGGLSDQRAACEIDRDRHGLHAV
ncbi:hypothetical protein J7F01_40395 [Streptomyces sp. ISL-22]|uniref:hypothetical protein n=1 Tax=unclassified Streptomyces TaxID=2593676 RepID=UPI001BEB66F8|nr:MULTISPECIES: hypothetical protein [unclassified Streptomyces]MBT2420587.1 hypothetical protein [Streptomyces sp. ISL-24]MBT2438276.1 hypothetical protein [Streptomyces sp. ISL-22]